MLSIPIVQTWKSRFREVEQATKVGAAVVGLEPTSGDHRAQGLSAALQGTCLT